MTTTSALIPEAETVIVGGEAIVINEFNTKQTLQALAAAFQLIEALEGKGEATIAQIFSAAPDAVLQIVAVAVGKPVAYVEALRPSDTLALVAAIIKVNKPFFTNEVLPKLAGLGGLFAGQASA